VFQADPDVDLRVLVLTDGQNNAGAGPEPALRACNKIGVIVDAIVVGNQPDADLRKIVAATGGSCFQIKSLGEAFELMESEAVVSLRARRGGGDKPPFKERPMPAGGFANAKAQSITRGRNAASVQSRSTASVAKKVVSCGVMAATTAEAAQAAVASSSGAMSSALAKRLMGEIAAVAKGKSSAWMHSGDGVHLFPGVNLLAMKALIEGPAGSPFEGGVFALNVSVPANYPFRAPTITFETAVHHCNVSSTGAVCMDMLHGGWSPSLSISKALEAIKILLGNPDTNNALRQWIAETTIMSLRSGGADTRYVEAAKAATAKDASLSVAAWKRKWGM
jgi:ubiquitin-protein ligase